MFMYQFLLNSAYILTVITSYGKPKIVPTTFRKIGPVKFPRTINSSTAELTNENKKIDVMRNLFLPAKVLYLLKATKAHKIRLVNRLISATINANSNISINRFLSNWK